jgi:trehalose-6-phosphate synthase
MMSSHGISQFRYVPNPSPSVFRTTKNNHNILQGVASPDLRLTEDQKQNFDQWIYKNGLRWTADGGPLAAGGVDIAFIGTEISYVSTNGVLSDNLFL